MPKDDDNNLKNEIYSVIKYSQPLSEHTVKREIKQTLSQYNHENDIHERWKYWEEWTTQICSQLSDTVDNKGIKNKTFDTINT